MAKIILFSIYLALALFVTPFTAVKAADEQPFKSTPYPVPRFVSLGADEVFVRSGPGKKYPIKWVFEKKELPVEVVLEFDHWRKIRDHEGQSGWVYGPLLSGKRTGLIQGEELVLLLANAEEDSAPKARLEPMVLVSIKSCAEQFCRIDAQGAKGWVKKADLWGVYPDEVF